VSLFVLDTDTLSLLERRHPEVARRIAARQETELAITVISVEEQMRGRLAELKNAKTLTALAGAYLRLTETMEALKKLPLLTFTEAAALRYEHLLALKLNVGKNDLKIAAIALENDAVIVTRSGRDFGRVPDLVIEDWTLLNV